MAQSRGIRIHQYLDNWLIRAPTKESCHQGTQSLLALCQELGWVVNLEKSELEPKQVFEFVGYQYDLSHGLVKPTQNCWESPEGTVHHGQPNLSSQELHVANRPAYSNRKTGAPGETPHETHPVAPQKTLEGPRISRERDSSPKVPSPTPSMVDQGDKCPARPASAPFASCHSNLYRHLKRRLGCSLRRLHSKRHLVSSRKSPSCKLPGTKSCLAGLKKIPELSTRKSSSSCPRQHHSCGIHQQGGRYEVKLTLCPSMATPVLVQSETGCSKGQVHPWSSKCDCSSQESDQSTPSRLAPRAEAIKEKGFSSPVESRIEARQRSSTRTVYEAKWSVFVRWCEASQVDFRSPSVKQIADFLLHLFQEKNLQPSTIDGYRSAIAEKLGNSFLNVSKDENITRLLDSFHRDRPKGRRGIPSWNLSLVLHQLTKPPFEPLRKASLKHLTFKTVFLLALGSGKHRSEIHAWLNKNIRHQADWSKVSLYPSPSFLAKNHLAKEGPECVAPVVIPALAPG